jgi:hypothetical protein
VTEAAKQPQLENNGFISDDSYDGADHERRRKQSVVAMTENVTGEIKNPLVGIPRDQLMADVDDFARKYGFDPETEVSLLRKGALVAQSPADFENMLELSDEDRDALRKEITHRYV